MSKAAALAQRLLGAIVRAPIESLRTKKNRSPLETRESRVRGEPMDPSRGYHRPHRLYHGAFRLDLVAGARKHVRMVIEGVGLSRQAPVADNIGRHPRPPLATWVVEALPFRMTVAYLVLAELGIDKAIRRVFES